MPILSSLLLFAATLPAVTAVPPVVVSTLKPATALYIDERGTIYACADQSFGLYVQPLGSRQQIAFLYVPPPNTVHANEKQKYVATCLKIK